MCGACGERGAFDWARPWTAGLAARRAVAVAAARAGDRRGLRVVADGGGWLVSGPTGATTACDGLGALVAAVRRWTGEPAPLDPTRSSGPLSVPDEPDGGDGRTGVVLRVGPGGARCADAALDGAGDMALVDSEATARAVLAALASPRWSARCYLERVEGVGAAWGRPAAGTRPEPAGLAADVLLRLEWARQSGRLDGAALAARGPLGPGAEYDVEVRDGHVVRARTQWALPPA